MRLPRLARVVLVLGACSGSGDERGAESPVSAPPTLSVAGPLEPIAEAAGCENIERLEPPVGRYGPSSRLRCVADDHLVMIDGFGGETPRGWLRTKHPLGSVNPCPDGSDARGPWIVLGADWVLFSNSAALASDVADRFGAELVHPGDEGPPVSTPLDPDLVCEAT